MGKFQFNAVMALFFTFVLFFIALSPFFYSKSITFLFMDHAVNTYGKEVAWSLHSQVYDFLLYEKPLMSQAFTSAEISHMHDVRNILLAWELVFLFCVVGIVVLSLLRLRYDIFDERVALFFGFFSYIGLFLLISILFLFRFSFGIFHKIFFSGNYTFPYDAVLVNLYTLNFFQFIGVFLFCVWIVMGGISLYYYALRSHS